MKCSHCGKDAAGSCKGCKEDPGADGDPFKTYYCNPACQKADWATHKSHCLRVQGRKDLYRLGDLIQQIYYTFKENAYDVLIRKLEVENGKLRVHLSPFSEEVPGQKCYPGLPCLVPFPNNMVDNLEDKLGLLVLMACNDSLANTHELVEYLLGGQFTTRNFAVLVLT